MKDMCETAKERYQKTLTVFEESLRRGHPTKLLDVCRENKVYYRGMLKWLYQSGRTIADIRKCVTAGMKPASPSKAVPSFVEVSEASSEGSGSPSPHLLTNVRLTLGKGISLSIETANAGSLAEFVIGLMKEGVACSD